MTSDPPVDLSRDLPPIWLVLGTGLVLALILAVLALPLYGHGVATLSRTFFLQNLLLWLLPLTLLQRRLWRSGWRPLATLLLLGCITLGMVILGKIMNLGLQARLGSMPFAFDLIPRGLEAAWLGLLAFAAAHAVITHAWALRESRSRLFEARMLARDAELRALRLQLQPHFLFNTLNAISGQVGDGRLREAQGMLARLGDFLRATLESPSGHEIGLADELSLAEAYLDIEKLRLGARLQLEWRVGPGVLDALVPPLLLQPLLENAIGHGLAQRREPGRLCIHIGQEGDRLRIDVVNDLPEDAHPTPRLGGVGLSNLRERLVQLYGERSSLDAGPDATGAYHVRVSLPFSTRA